MWQGGSRLDLLLGLHYLIPTTDRTTSCRGSYIATDKMETHSPDASKNHRLRTAPKSLIVPVARVDYCSPHTRRDDYNLLSGAVKNQGQFGSVGRSGCTRLGTSHDSVANVMAVTSLVLSIVRKSYLYDRLYAGACAFGSRRKKVDRGIDGSVG